MLGSEGNRRCVRAIVLDMGARVSHLVSGLGRSMRDDDVPGYMLFFGSDGDGCVSLRHRRYPLVCWTC